MSQPDETTQLLSSETENEIIDYVNIHRDHTRRLLIGLAVKALLQANQLRPHHLGPHFDISSIISSHSVGTEPHTTFKDELKSMLVCSIPIIITFLLQYSLTVALVFSVGRIGSTELAAVSLSLMTANITGYAVIQGIATCLDTLCAQAYGRQEYNMVGIYLMRCTIMVLCLGIPMMLFWGFGLYPVLVKLIGDHELASLAASYLRVVAFGLPGYILFETSKHYLQAQGIFNAMAYILVISATTNAILNYVLVWDSRVGMGYIGAPLSVTITNYLMCFLIFAYIYFVDGYQCWPKQPIWDKIYWRNWGKMSRLATAGVIMVELEWLAFEVITLEAARFGTVSLAAQLIVSTTTVLFYQIPFAIGISCSTRVAWFLGAASKQAAKTTVQAGIMIAIVIGVASGLVLFFGRYWFAGLYTSDNAVIAIAAKVMVIGLIYQVNDFISCTTGGVLRGQGRQEISGYVSLGSYYGLGLPCAYFFGFVRKWELMGLWTGMIIALFTILTVQLYYVYISNWDTIINEAITDGIDNHEI